MLRPYDKMMMVTAIVKVASNCGHGKNLTNYDEWYLLGPKLNVEMQAEVIDGDFEASRDWVDSAHAIEDDVDRRYEDFPHAIQGEEVTQGVEVAPFESFWVNDAFLMISEIVQL